MVLRKRISDLALLLSVIIAVSFPAREAKSELLLYSDLSLHFECDNVHEHNLEKAALTFLYNAGFRVINEGKLLRNHDSGIFDTYVIALDKNKRSVEILSLPPRSKNYMLTFITKPPTIRDEEFEKKLEDFISSTGYCHITQKTREENGANKVNNFDKYIVDRFNTLQAEVEQLDHDGKEGH